jgi:hypothetical protein
LLAAVNRDTGEVTRVMTGVGHEAITVERHPDTNTPVLGATLPDWKKLKELCLTAARTIPGVTLQGWDVAPTDRGPVLVEVNVGGHFNLPQLATGVGMLEDRFRDFLLSQGVRPKSAVDRLAELGKKMYFRIGGVRTTNGSRGGGQHH